jgi:DNA-binding NarL/FixJ family response regulator
MDAIKEDYQNLRTSLTWFLKQKEEQRTGEQALRLAAALTPFWIASGILNEGCAFLEQALSDSETRNSSVRAKALMQLGHLLRLQIRLQSNFERPAATAVAQPDQGHPSTATPGVIASRPLAPKDAALSAGLTRRETDVLRLLAKGLTDAKIAEQLVLSRRTVNWYLTVIYQKIGVSSRSAATRYALEQQLV